MAFKTIHVSIRDEEIKILEELKKKYPYGIQSLIFQKAIREFANIDLSLDSINKKLKEAEQRKLQADQDIQNFKEIQTKLIETEQENGFIKIQQEIDEESPKIKKEAIEFWKDIYLEDFEIDEVQAENIAQVFLTERGKPNRRVELTYKDFNESLEFKRKTKVELIEVQKRPKHE